MYQSGYYKQLIQENHNEKCSFTINLGSLEKLDFEPLDGKSGVIEILGKKKRFLYSLVGNKSIFTMHFTDCDYNGEVQLRRIRANRHLVENILLEHVSNAEKLEDRHQERIDGLYKDRLSWKRRDLPELASSKYSDIILALGYCLLPSNKI